MTVSMTFAQRQIFENCRSTSDQPLAVGHKQSRYGHSTSGRWQPAELSGLLDSAVLTLLCHPDSHTCHIEQVHVRHPSHPSTTQSEVKIQNLCMGLNLANLYTITVLVVTRNGTRLQHPIAAIYVPIVGWLNNVSVTSQ